ncbi:hypothetical protein MHB48_10715 [Psychrobacillus sp. FSL H8-0483]|uniref:hypothetical protein n=1 Tax=Psychrobacillus sp. FSL H8-0483 TaxID=2921389 RepID=UPI003159BAE5
MVLQLFRSRNYLTYYKKYYCEECFDFSIRVHTDTACECKNGCTINIQNVDFTKYDGFYDREEIEQKFYFNEFELLDKIIPMFEGLTVNFSTLSKKESEEINNFFLKKHFTEIQIDDIVAKHLKNKGLKNLPDKMDNFGYILNLIEDIHHFLIRACQDIALYDIALEYKKKEETIPFHTARFFFYNSIESVWYSYERIIVYLGLKYKFEFKDNYELNTTVKIRDYLKKDINCKESRQYKLLKEYIDKNIQFIDEIRKNNTHSMSKHILDINERVKKNAEESFEIIFNNNANYYDEKTLKPQITKLISAINNLYMVLISIIEDFTKNIEIFEILHIPMLAEFEEPIDKKLFVETDKTFDLKQIDYLKAKLFLDLNSLNKDALNNENFQLIWDIFFRLEDIQKCIVDTYNLENGYLIQEWSKNISPEIVRFLDEKNLLYAGLSRIYSVLDKLSRYISSKYEIGSIKYFKDIANLSDTYESALIKKAIKLANSNEYRLMYTLRNRIAHNLSSGALMGKQGIEYDNYYILYCVSFLTFSCYELIGLELQKFK